MSLGITLFIVGVVIGFLAFAFAGRNMIRAFTSNDPGNSFERLLKGHIGAMIVMAFGGVVSIIGAILAIVDFASRLIR